MYLIDTNIFLEVFLNQEKAEDCQLFLSRLSGEASGVVTAFAVHAIEVILTDRGRQEALRQWLKALDDKGYLTVYSTTIAEEIEISDLTKSSRLDFDDSLQYYVARKKGLTLVTLDKDFAEIRDVRVVTPKDA